MRDLKSLFRGKISVRAVIEFLSNLITTEYYEKLIVKGILKVATSCLRVKDILEKLVLTNRRRNR